MQVTLKKKIKQMKILMYLFCENKWDGQIWRQLRATIDILIRPTQAWGCIK